MTVEPDICSLSHLLAPYNIEAPDILLSDLVLDSREVAIHKAFLAVKGHSQDGRDFIPQAVSLGAKVIIADTDDPEIHGEMDMREHSLIVQFFQLQQHIGALAERFFGAPSQKLTSVAITGTNGKTSTTHFCCQLANSLSQESVFVGTLGQGRLGELAETANTTPDAISMHRIAYKAVAAQANFLAYEASSHALVQGRTDNFDTKVAVFTNLSREHLDYHGTMQEYAAAKRRLLLQPGLHTAIINIDDPEAGNWLSAMPATINAVAYGLGQLQPEATQYCIAKRLRLDSKGTQFTLCSSWGDAEIAVPLYGKFNVYNLLAAIAVHLANGALFDDVVDAVGKIQPVNGRAEHFSHSQYPDVVVDYAHTPDALANILSALRAHASGKLFCIFGCGGDRDVGKRPLMAKVAEQLADQVVVTNDNSRTEKPEDIVQDILQGMSYPEAAIVELDRTVAIKKAIELAGADDVILVAGKGHEDYQLIDGAKIDYDEREFIRSLYYGEKQ